MTCEPRASVPATQANHGAGIDQLVGIGVGQLPLGFCNVCSRGHHSSPKGQPLPDVSAAIAFIAEHSHWDVD